MEGTVYEHLIENNLDFKLKPGHKAIILSLPQALKIYEVKNKKICVSNVSEVDLKHSLVKKITNFANKNLYELNFTLELISDFHQENGAHKCRFECPICSTKIRCEYRKYWLISNLEVHMKNHYKHIEFIELDREIVIDPNEEEQQLNIEPNLSQVISYVAGPDQMNALNDILDG